MCEVTSRKEPLEIETLRLVAAIRNAIRGGADVATHVQTPDHDSRLTTTV